MKISPHFDLREFVPKAIFDQYGANSIWFLDDRLIEGAEWLRAHFNAPITINNWHTGGSFQNRGFRAPNTTVGARLSQHKFGRAIDFNVAGMTAAQVAKDLIDSGHIDDSPWTTIEDPAHTATWTHLDMRQTRSNDLLIVRP